MLDSSTVTSDSENKTRGHSHPVTVPQAQLLPLAKPEDTADPSHGCPSPATGSCPLARATDGSRRTTSARQLPAPQASLSARLHPESQGQPVGSDPGRAPCAVTYFERPGRPMWGPGGRRGDTSSPRWAANSLQKPGCSSSSNAAPTPTARWCPTGSGPSALQTCPRTSQPTLSIRSQTKIQAFKHRRVKQNLIFDLSLCPTLLPLAPSSTSLWPFAELLYPLNSLLGKSKARASVKTPSKGLRK